MKKAICMLLAFLGTGACAFAQGHPARHDRSDTRLIGYEEKSESAYHHLRSNAPDEFNSDGVPHFIVFGDDRKFLLGIGGYVKVTGSMDWGHPVESPDEFTTSNIPVGPTDGNGAAFKFSARQSQIFINFVALPGSENQIGAFFSMNFLNDYAPVLQFAYLKYRGFQAGYDYSLFGDPAAGPPMIDYEGPNAVTAIPVAGIRYGVDFGRGKSWNFSVGAEMPQISVTNLDGHTAAVSQRVPTFPLALKYSWDGGDSWLRFAAVVRNLYYRDLLASSNVDKVGYGIQLSGSAKILPDLTAYYEGVFGKGIANMIQDTDGQGIDLCPSANGQTLNTVKAWGAYGALQYDWSPKVFSTVGYSHVRTYANTSDIIANAMDSQYRYAQYAFGNLFWNISPIFQTGIEYIWGRRVDYGGAKAGDSRLQAMVQLNF